MQASMSVGVVRMGMEEVGCLFTGVGGNGDDVGGCRAVSLALLYPVSTVSCAQVSESGPTTMRQSSPGLKV